MTVLGRSGRFEAGSDLAHALRDGWAASVTFAKCDVAFIEDTSAVFSRSSAKGQCFCMLQAHQPPKIDLCCPVVVVEGP